jgi:V8-like Glu-specific endopeptidase
VSGAGLWRLRHVAVAVAVALPGLAGVPGPAGRPGPPDRAAWAAPSTGGDRVVRDARSRAVGVVREAATTPARERAVRAYWTRERMAAAIPVGLRVADGRAVTVTIPAGPRVARGAAAGSTVARLSPTRAPVVTGAAWPYAGAVVRTTGKVFFTMAGQNYVCSGSAVASPDASTVLTAGHCVNSGGDVTGAGVMATSWAFVPGYADGARPYGTFTATHLATTTGWVAGSDFDVDLAYANVGRNESGQTLAEAVGGQPIGFDRARGGPATVFGYPAASPFTGQRLTYCTSLLLQDSFYLSPDQGLRCDMTPGSSGGPWLAGFDTSTGTGTLVSVTSFIYTAHPGYLWGPYLGSTAQTLYAAVASTTSS